LDVCAARLSHRPSEDDREDLLHEAAMLMDGMAIGRFRRLGLTLRYEIEITDDEAALRFAKSTRRFRVPRDKRKQLSFLTVFLQKFAEEHRAIGDVMLAPPRDARGGLSLPTGEMLDGFFVRPMARFFDNKVSTERPHLAK